jgi:hypothetical protein
VVSLSKFQNELGFGWGSKVITQSTCGTHLFYHLLPADEYILPAGLFEDGSDFKMTSQIFIDEKPGNYEFSNATPAMTGEQVFAQFAESSN